MNKQELAAMLEKEKNRFHNIYGGETVLYAEKDPNPKPLINRFAGMRKPENVMQIEWDKFIAELEAGTYKPGDDPEKDLWWRERRVMQNKVAWSTDKNFFK